jgi:ribosomal protein L11 methyltransferase
MRWLELASRVDAEAVEAVSEVFANAVSGGVWVEPDVISGSDDGYTLGSQATVRAYLPLVPEARCKARAVEVALGHLNAIWPVGELRTREVADEDWANAWKAHFTTFRIGRRLVIRPSWLEYVPELDDVVVALDPGAAFGTGLHPTTRRCLEVLEEVVRPGARVLDVGTGSGILALAAAGLGAAAVVGVDVDPIAVETARANVTANGLADRIRVAENGLAAPEAAGVYDIVVANIIARVVVELAPQLVDHLARGGVLVAGGIIAERAADVEAALDRLGLRVERLADGDWITMVARADAGA